MRSHKNRPTRAQVEEALKEAKSISEVGRNLGFNPGGSMYQRVRAIVAQYDLELPVWDYRESAKMVTNWNRLSDEEWFSYGVARSGQHTRKRMIDCGVLYMCSVPDCVLYGTVNPTWAKKPITLHVDHVDGDRLNNRIENLRFLCPNCHQQTDTKQD